MSFSIKQLLSLIAMVALGLVALLNARWPAARTAVDLLATIILVMMIYGIWLTRGASRAFRIGFVGWVVLFLIAPVAGLAPVDTWTAALLDRVAPIFRPAFAQGQVAMNAPSPWIATGPGQFMLGGPTNTPTTDAGTFIVSPPQQSASTPGWSTFSFTTPGSLGRLPPAPAMTSDDELEWGIRYHAIGRCLIGLLLGLVGGWMTVFLYRRRERAGEGG
jgi:hypothetical protein